MVEIERNILGLPSFTGITPLKARQEKQVLKYDFKGVGPLVVDKSLNGHGGTLKPNWPVGSARRKTVSIFPLKVKVVFDGEDDHIDLGSEATLSTGEWSLVVKFKAGEVTGNHNLVSSGMSKGFISQYLSIRYGTLRFYDNEVGTWRGSDTRIARGELHEAGFVYDGEGTVQFYLDGVKDGKGSIGTDYDTLDVRYIGIYQDAESRPFDGEMYYVKIYDKALSADEMKEV